MRLEQQKRKKENKTIKTFKNMFFIIAIILFIVISSLFGFGIGMFIEQKNYVENIGKIEIPEATFIFAVNDDPVTGTNEVIAKLYKENRTNVELKNVPQNLQNAIIAIEDKRFYEHNGVDIRGIGRAFVKNLTTSSYSQGASTISMQLARNVKLNSKKTISRKIQEVIIAAQMEKTMTKEEILEAYLNSIYLGSGAFGVETAANVYFGKHVSELNLSQCATIAGLPKAPSTYDPHKNKKAATERRNVVLKAMYEQGYIGKKEYDQAKNENLIVKTKTTKSILNKFPQVTNAVIDELKKRFDEEQIYNGGLRVYTTVDTRIMKAAEKACRNKLGKKKKNGIECALMSMDPNTGYILGFCGSLDPQSEYNRAMKSGLQLGSVFKPIVYYTAMEKLNWGPDTKISNERFTRGDWTPKNNDNRYGGHPTMKVAIEKSINLPAIRAGEESGMKNVVDMAKRLGINSKLPPYLSTCIGAGNVKLYEMLQVYNVTSTGGRMYTPTIIRRVYDTSKSNCLVDNTRRTGKRVLSERLAKTMDSLLRSVITNGTGRSVSYISDARGKTGTNGKTDVAFAGYVPNEISAIVWIGHDQHKNIPYSYSGGGTCGPIWAQFMKESMPYFDEDRKKEKEQEEKELKALKQAQRERELAEKYRGDTESQGVVVDRTETNNTSHSEDSVYDTDEEYYDADVVEENDTQDESEEDTIYVDVCPTSNKVPNPNCPSSVLKKFKLSEAPTETCDIH